MAGLKFKRQHPIGDFIVDFYCGSQKLVIELDGESHDTQLAYDEARTRWLRGQGYCVIRFANEEVVRQMDAVLETIWRECGGSE